MSRLETYARPALRRVLCLANPLQQMPADDRNCLSVSKVGAFIKVLQLCAKCLQQLRFGKSVHRNEQDNPTIVVARK